MESLQSVRSMLQEYFEPVEQFLTEKDISTTWILVGSAVGLLVIHQLHAYTYFWRRGIPGPMPLPLAGNILSFITGSVPALAKWKKKYGDNFGIYQGKTPTLVTSDKDLARMITTKEFSSFQAFDSGNLLNIKYFKDSLLQQTGAQWKRSRSFMSPTFSGSKMRLLIPALNERCNVMLEVLEKKRENGEGFETKLVLMPYVLDCIACCCFGVQANCQTDPDDPFIKHSAAIADDLASNPGFILATLFPSLLPLFTFLGLEIIPEKSMDFFADIVRRVIELRNEEEGKNERKDFIQLLIDAAEMGGEDPAAQNGSTDVTQVTRKKLPITVDEILGQSLVFFFAGYDTIATSTGFALYALACNPDIQARLQEEIDDMIPEGKTIDYDTVFKMEYLDKCWQEAQRMYPVGFLLTRACNKEFSYNGVNLSVGDNVFINNWAIHHDPENWPEPEMFDPERFTKEAKEARHPCSYMPFGQGPRNCVGMRFAILESKMILITILRKYNLTVAPETPDLSNLKSYGVSSLYPHKGLHIRHTPRD